MKFFAAVGNPPYQQTTENTSDKPVYNLFMDASYKVAEKVELITPARFLFNAGKTPKEWNEKMLNDEHLKVVYYNQDSAKVFPGTDIKGGVAVTYRDSQKNFGAIVSFSNFKELNSILNKVKVHPSFESILPIIYLQNKFNLELLYQDYPHYISIIGSKGTEKRLTTKIFDQLDCFDMEKKNSKQVGVQGLINNRRIIRYIDKKYIEPHINLGKWKVLIPKSNGTGAIGEVLSTPLIGEPLIGFTQSFISFGAFDNEYEANSLIKYIKSKFARTMLGILKITQDNPPEKWKFVPLQDFTSNSDINWNVSIKEIDKQFYKKYGLSPEEVEFIETHVQEMN